MGPSLSHTETEEALCPVYEEAHQNPKWQKLLSGPVVTEPKCGHLIKRLVNEKGGLSDNTIRSYSSSGAHFIHFLHEIGTTAREAEYSDIEQFFHELSERILSTETYKQYRTTIIHLYKNIEVSSECTANVTSSQILEWLTPEEYPSRERIERDPLSKEEVKKLCEEMNCLRDQLMVRIGVEWGARNRSICKIKVRHIDLDKKVARVEDTKSGGMYKVAITDKSAMLLRHWLNVERKAYLQSSENKFLFPSREGGSLTRDFFSKLVREGAKDAGIQEVLATIEYNGRQKEIFGTDKRNFYRVTPHTLRHTFNELLRDCGVSREVRSKALNHSNTKVTKDYYEHSSEEHIQVIKDVFPTL